MVQRSNMWYAYFRFYINESDISVGLNEYCKEWENMTPVGYNYLEYKCFVDNIGGFEHWVGDMGGYISQSREVGFIDGSPSDNVYDSNLLMGMVRKTITYFKLLNIAPTNISLVIRKTICSHSSTGTLKIKFNASNIFEHKFYIAYDEVKIERFNFVQEIVDSSNCTYSATCDLDTDVFIPVTVDSYLGVSNIENSVDDDFSTYALWSSHRPAYSWMIFNLGSIINIHGIGIKWHNESETVNPTLYVQGSNDKITWTEIYHETVRHGITEYFFEFIDRNVDYRYIRLITSNTTSENGRLYGIWVTKN